MSENITVSFSAIYQLDPNGRYLITVSPREGWVLPENLDEIAEPIKAEFEKLGVNREHVVVMPALGFDMNLSQISTV